MRTPTEIAEGIQMNLPSTRLHQKYLFIVIMILVVATVIFITSDQYHKAELKMRKQEYHALYETFQNELDITMRQRAEIADREEDIYQLHAHIRQLSALSPLLGLLSTNDVNEILETLTPSSPFDSSLRVTSRFGEGTGYQGALRKGHRGTDIVPMGNWKIRAMWKGTVTDIGIHNQLGKYLIIQHSDNVRTLYAHLEKIYFSADAGTVQGQGDILGIMGETGRTSGAHLHLELQIHDGESWKAVDIYSFLEGRD